PFERLYAVDPVGAAQITPSHGRRPRSSPPIDQESSIMRPTTELAATTSLTAGQRVPSSSTSSVGSSSTRKEPPKMRGSSVSSASCGTAVRKPTRPKFTPSAGTPVPRKRWSARSIVPSPPSTTARSASSTSVRHGSRRCFSTSSSANSSSTPAFSATRCSRATAGPIASGLPCVTTATRRTGSADGAIDPAVELIGDAGFGGGGEEKEELAVSFRSGQARVYHGSDLGTPLEHRLRDLAEHPAVRVRVADDSALADVRPPGLELGLDENERAPAGRGERERRRQRLPHRDERDVADDEVGRVWKLLEAARVRALEHGHARVGAQARVELAVADVERDHVRRPALEQHVGEAAGRGADVEGPSSGHVQPQRVQRVRELLPTARDVRRRALDLELRVDVDLLARLRVAGHKSGEDERLRLRPALREAALDEERVEPSLHATRLARRPAPEASRLSRGVSLMTPERSRSRLGRRWNPCVSGRFDERLRKERDHEQHKPAPGGAERAWGRGCRRPRASARRRTARRPPGATTGPEAPATGSGRRRGTGTAACRPPPRLPASRSPGTTRSRFTGPRPPSR